MLKLTHSRRIFTSCARSYSEEETCPRSNAAAAPVGVITMLDSGAPALAGVNVRFSFAILGKSSVWLQSCNKVTFRRDGVNYARVRKASLRAGLVALMTAGAGSFAARAETPKSVKAVRADHQQLSSGVALSPVAAPGSATVSVIPQEALEALPALQVSVGLTAVGLSQAQWVDGKSLDTVSSTGSVGAAIEPVEEDFLEFDGMRVPRQLLETILKASEATSVDPVYMMALADKESSFIPHNKASSSSAEGLLQFLEGTWLEIVKSFGAEHGLVAESAAIQVENGQFTIADDAMREHIIGLRRDPYLSALMAAEMLKRDRNRIERRVGRTITRSEFYLAHFFGVGGATRFITNLDDRPKQSAPKLFPAAAKANRALFYDRKGKKTRHLSVAEVYNRIDEMIDERLDRYADVRVDDSTVISDAGL